MRWQKGPVNSITSSAWPNQTYSHILSYWLIVCGYEISANRRAVSLSALASFQYTTTTNYTNDRALLKFIPKKLCYAKWFTGYRSSPKVIKFI